MPIIGKVNVRHRQCRLSQMDIGDEGFIENQHILVIKDCLYLHHDTGIIHLPEGDTVEEFMEVFPECVYVKRIGSEMTEHDFELDFSRGENEDNDFVIENVTTYINMVAECEHEYIVFKEGLILAPIDEKKRKKIDPELNLEILRKQLEEAVRNEDYPKAAELREKINEAENKK